MIGLWRIYDPTDIRPIERWLPSPLGLEFRK